MTKEIKTSCFSLIFQKQYAKVNLINIYINQWTHFQNKQIHEIQQFVLGQFCTHIHTKYD